MVENALTSVIHSFLATTVEIAATNKAARTNVLRSFFWAWASFAIHNMYGPET